METRTHTTPLKPALPSLSTFATVLGSSYSTGRGTTVSIICLTSFSLFSNLKARKRSLVHSPFKRGKPKFQKRKSHLRPRSPQRPHRSHNPWSEGDLGGTDSDRRKLKGPKTAGKARTNQSDSSPWSRVAVSWTAVESRRFVDRRGESPFRGPP